MGRMMREYLLPLFGTFGFTKYLKHDPSDPDSDVTPEYCAKHNWIVGSPKTVTEKIEMIYEEVGGFGTLLLFGFDYADNPRPGATRSSCSPRKCCPRCSTSSPSNASWLPNNQPPPSGQSHGGSRRAGRMGSSGRRLCQARPICGLHARDGGEAALAVGPEDRGLAFADVEPVLAEGVHDVGLMGDDDDVRAGGRRR